MIVLVNSNEGIEDRDEQNANGDVQRREEYKDHEILATSDNLEAKLKERDTKCGEVTTIVLQ